MKQCESDKKKLNVEAKSFCPKTAVAAIASVAAIESIKIKDIVEQGDSIKIRIGHFIVNIQMGRECRDVQV